MKFALPKRLGLLLTVLATGCADGTATNPVVTQCVLPTDQASTLMGHWKYAPVPIAWHQGDFTPTEISVMVAAADTWNAFYEATRGFQALDYGTAASPRVSTVPVPSSPSAESVLNGQGTFNYATPVVVYKSTTWPPAYPAQAMAITTHYSDPASPLGDFYFAMVQVNYQNFFNAGQQVPDLQSIVLHEFGHVMGLNHSCESSGTTGVPACAESGLDPDYVSALMYPVFTFDSSGNPQIKRSLATNDMERANCLYDPKFTGQPTNGIE